MQPLAHQILGHKAYSDDAYLQSWGGACAAGRAANGQLCGTRAGRCGGWPGKGHAGRVQCAAAAGGQRDANRSTGALISWEPVMARP
jgi:hypothetical protein